MTETTLCACANCDWRGDVSDADACRDFWSRVEPGDTVPAGDCPECGAFAFLEPGAPAAASPGADYLERFPPEHRESADRAYSDGFADGANNVGEDGEDGEDSEPQSARAGLEADADAFEREGSLAQAAECRRAAEAAFPDPEGQSARLPWFVCVSPAYYDDPCDTGYNWEGEADDRDDAVRQALIQCHIDNDRAYEGQPEEDWPDDHYGEPETIDPDDLSVTVHAAEPDFRAIGLAVHKGEPGALAVLARALRAVHQI